MQSESDQRFAKYGPLAVVTGASDGIGKAFAEHLARLGFSLILVARRRDRLEELAQALISKHGVRAVALAVDLGVAGSAQAVIDAAKAADAGLLIAAAGFGSSGPFLSRNIDSELQMIDLNCRAVTELAFGLAVHFQRRGAGGIVLMGSLVGRQGAPFAATYAATKAYVHAFGEALAVELNRDGVDVLVSAPGPVRSGFASRAGMSMGATDDPHQVAAQTLAALGRRRMVVPGRIGRFLTFSLVALPRFARLLIIGRIMRSMAENGAH
jgi:short-subunit dehydrogenase